MELYGNSAEICLISYVCNVLVLKQNRTSFCFLCAVLPRSTADNDVVVDKCTEEETNKKDMECAHTFLNAMTDSSVNCRYVK